MKPTNSPTKIITKKGTLLKQLLSKDTKIISNISEPFQKQGLKI